jgi:hypothetical protein
LPSVGKCGAFDVLHNLRDSGRQTTADPSATNEHPTKRKTGASRGPHSSPRDDKMKGPRRGAEAPLYLHRSHLSFASVFPVQSYFVATRSLLPTGNRSHYPGFPLLFPHISRGGSQYHGRLFHLATLPREAVHLQIRHHRRQRHPYPAASRARLFQCGPFNTNSARTITSSNIAKSTSREPAGGPPRARQAESLTRVPHPAFCWRGGDFRRTATEHLFLPACLSASFLSL